MVIYATRNFSLSLLKNPMLTNGASGTSLNLSYIVFILFPNRTNMLWRIYACLLFDKSWSLVNETINRLTCAFIHCLTFKVVDYNAQIGESGEHFNETIEVDTERQTELFKVPAHGNVDHSNILNDFKTVSIVTITRKNM